MIRHKSKFALCFLFMLGVLILSACSQSDFESGFSNFFDIIISAVSNVWYAIVRFFKAIGTGLEDILSGMLTGLSGIGNGLRNMFGGF